MIKRKAPKRMVIDGEPVPCASSVIKYYSPNGGYYHQSRLLALWETGKYKKKNECAKFYFDANKKNLTVKYSVLCFWLNAKCIAKFKRKEESGEHKKKAELYTKVIDLRSRAIKEWEDNVMKPPEHRRSLSSIARDFGISDNTMHGWCFYKKKAVPVPLKKLTISDALQGKYALCKGVASLLKFLTEIKEMAYFYVPSYRELLGHGGAGSGWADFLNERGQLTSADYVVMANGRCVFIEIQSRKDKCNQPSKMPFRKLCDRTNIPYHVCCSVGQVERVVEEFLSGKSWETT